MKLMLFFLTLSLSSLAGTISVDYNDQIKLAEMLNRVDHDFKIYSQIDISKPVPGHQTRETLQDQSLGFAIQCDRSFYNDSPYPSKVKCVVTVNEKHPSFDRRNDEIKFKIKDDQLAQTFYDAIPYGTNGRKRFSSFYRDVGRIFEGDWSNVFHYYFDCSVKECIVKFSNIKYNP